MPVTSPPEPVLSERLRRRLMSRRRFLLKAAAGLALSFFGRAPALSADRAALPPLDRAAPSATETATFAMG